MSYDLCDDLNFVENSLGQYIVNDTHAPLDWVLKIWKGVPFIIG